MNPVIECYTTNYNTLIRLAARLTKSQAYAEDIVQDLWIELNKTKTNLSKVEAPLAYCRRSVACLFFKEVRLSTRRNQRDFELQEELLLARQDWLDDLAILPLRMDLIAEFSNLLLKRQKAVFTAMLQGKSIIQIAKEHGRTYNTTKHNRKIILDKLQTFFAEKGEEFTYERKQGNNNSKISTKVP